MNRRLSMIPVIVGLLAVFVIPATAEITSDNYRIREIAEIVKETVPNCRIEFAEDASPDTRCYRVDCSKLPRTLPSFTPQWNARKGAQELYEAFKRHGLGREQFEGPRYQRGANVKQLLSTGQLDKNLRWNVPVP